MAVDIKIHAENLDGETLNQIYKISGSPAFEGTVAIMPDAHAGAGCCVGFTGRFSDYIIPSVVGVDIGCGVKGCYIGDKEIDYAELDKFLKETIPLGMNSRKVPVDLSASDERYLELASEIQHKIGRVKNPVANQVGTLGGGNHFIEVGEDYGLGKWVFIHSGSRNFGLTVANYYQQMATVGPKGLEALPMDEGGKDYLADMKIAQQVARINRTAMMNSILEYLDAESYYTVDCVHNYIGDDGYIRKGAISAYTGEPVLIPLNMRDGTVVGRGIKHPDDPLGNPDYNYSAPHGAGRLFGRGYMKRGLKSGEFTMEQFQEEMTGIYTTTATEGTIDESPFAYKPYETIEKYLKETVTVETIVKPKYNLKAAE